MADNYSRYSELVNKSWAASHDESRCMYEEDDFDACIDSIQSQLDDSGLPRYFRLKLLCLISACLDDWYEAKQALDTADMIWRKVRRHHRDTSGSRVEASLWEIHQSIDYLREQHGSEPPPEPEEDSDVDDEEVNVELGDLEEEETDDEEEDSALPQPQPEAEVKSKSENATARPATPNYALAEPRERITKSSSSNITTSGPSHAAAFNQVANDGSHELTSTIDPSLAFPTFRSRRRNVSQRVAQLEQLNGDADE